MARNSKLFAVTMASLLVLVAFTPGALAASAANAAANTSVDVSTEAASDVTADEATLNGNVTELNGTETASVAFQYWEAGDSENKTTVDAGSLTEAGEFSADVDGLSPDTTYVYVATGEAGNVASVGAEQEFTTLETLDVSVETDGMVNVTATNATFEGNLTDVQGAENASVSFRYYEQGQRNTTDVLPLDEQSEGNFSADVSDLSPNTTYVVVAQAEVKRGDETADATGASVNFTTDDATQPLGIETANASDVTNASATLNGELTGLNGSENASVAFEYWVGEDRENSTTTTAVDLDAPASFSAAVDGLAGNTTYVYVATAEAGDESVAGETVTFTTRPDVLPLGVETTDATSVTNDSVTLGGELTGLNGSDGADVSFEYWVEGNESNTTITVDAGNLSDTGSFGADVSGLQNNTTYVYVAEASVGNAATTGGEVTFSTGAVEDEGFEAPEGPFGQQIVAYIDYLREETDKTGRGFGQAVAAFASGQNPGADNRPDHAGPPEDKGPSAEKERGPPADKERGPPDHAGPDADEEDAETEDKEEEQEDSEAEEEDSDDDEEEEDDEGGPPEGKGYNK
jgi:hypothetical protein